MRLLRISLCIVALLSVAVLARAEGPEVRTALVIGNADYSFGPLRNPINDAEAMASATPVVYALTADLTGLWDAGKGEETLTPEQ
jgi:hypothetical protein